VVDILKSWRTPPGFDSTPGVAGQGGIHPLSLSSPSGGLLPGGVAPGSFTRTVPPILQVKPPQGVDFAPGGSGSFNSANTPATVTGVTVDVPLGSVAYLRSFVLQVNTLLPVSAITFAVRANGVPVAGFDQLYVIPANLAVWNESWGPDEIFLEIAPGTTLDIAVTVTDAATYTIGAAMHGWYVPLELVQSFDQGWS